LFGVRGGVGFDVGVASFGALAEKKRTRPIVKTWLRLRLTMDLEAVQFPEEGQDIDSDLAGPAAGGFEDYLIFMHGDHQWLVGPGRAVVAGEGGGGAADDLAGGGS
jgi:hypothetical protein